MSDVFFFDIGNEVIDIADIDEQNWNRIKTLTKKMIANKITKDPGLAYILGFTQWISERYQLAELDSRIDSQH